MIYKPKQTMNKTEQRYSIQLEMLKLSRQIIEWRFEPLKFKLAKNTLYTPDFLVVTKEHMKLVEIKGFLRDDAAVKFKMARELYPWFEWEMVRLYRGEWKQVRI